MTKITIDSFEKLVSDNADKLIKLGRKEWIKSRKKKKYLKEQQEQLREIEDNLIEDKID